MDLFHKLSAFIMSIKVNGKKIDKIINSFQIKSRQALDFDINDNITVAAVQYQIKEHKKITEYLQDINSLVGEAVSHSAQLVVFPELMGITSMSLVPFKQKIFANLSESKNKSAKYTHLIDLFSDFMFDMYFHTFSELSRRHNVYIVAGSTYVFTQGKLYNRAFLFAPDGEIIGSQDKAFPSKLEIDSGVNPADTIEVFRTKIGNIAISFGDDAKYYELFKIASLNGANIFAIPSIGQNEYNSFKDISTVAARSTELGVFAIKPCLVGKFISGDVLLGRSGIYSPLGLIKKNLGVVANADSTSKQQIIYGKLDFDVLRESKDNYNSSVNSTITDKYSKALVKK